MSKSNAHGAVTELRPGQVWRTRAGGLYKIPEGINPLCFDLVEMVRDEDGFTIWRGGEMPEEVRGAQITVRHRDGNEYTEVAGTFYSSTWEHVAFHRDIVAYKVVEAAAEAPAVIGIDPGAEGGDRHVVGVDIPPGYHKLFGVLMRAFEQAAGGKGKERHAKEGVPFEGQPMSAINKQLGSVDGFIYQAHKKSLESKRLPDGRAQAELLGSINYLCGAVIALDTWAKKDSAAD